MKDMKTKRAQFFKEAAAPQKSLLLLLRVYKQMCDINQTYLLHSVEQQEEGDEV